MTIEHDVWTTWQGEWMFGDEKKPVSVRLRFGSDGAVEGDGEDPFGAFTQHGTRDGDRLALTSTYPAWQQGIEGTLDAGEGEFRGVWRFGKLMGAFVLRRLTETGRFAVSAEQAGRIQAALADYGKWRLYVRTGKGWEVGERRTLLAHDRTSGTELEGLALGLLFEVPQFSSLPPWASFDGLPVEHLDVAGGDGHPAKVTALTGLEALPALRSLDASYCEARSSARSASSEASAGSVARSLAVSLSFGLRASSAR